MLQTAIHYGEAYIQINGKPQEGGLGGGKGKREEVRLASRSQKGGECKGRGQVTWTPGEAGAGGEEKSLGESRGKSEVKWEGRKEGEKK